MFPLQMWLSSQPPDRVQKWAAATFKTMRPEMITQMIRKQFFCVTNVCAIRKLIPRQIMCVVGALTENSFIGARITQRIPARKPCVTDVLCNWEINSQIVKLCVCSHF